MARAKRAPGDEASRKVIREDLDRTLFVEAAAGTGKTTELVERMVNILARGGPGDTVDRMVAVTFTERAAGELKLRLRVRLEGARSAADDEASRAALDRALQRLEEAHINTIHGFCAELLRERPVEAGVDPRFRVLTEAEADRLFAQAFDGWLQACLEDPPEGVRRALRRRSAPWMEEDDGPAGRLLRAARTLSEWRDFAEPWMTPTFEGPSRVQGLVTQLYGFAALTERARFKNDVFFTDTRAARRVSEDVQASARVRDEGQVDVDEMEATLVELSADRDFMTRVRRTGRDYADLIPRQAVVDAHAQLVAELGSFKRDADADLAARLREELQAPIQRYERLKRTLGYLDFVDLLLLTRDLVRDHEDVRRDFQARFSRIFVDEFQDTDPLQAEILLLLAAHDPGERRWRSVRPVPGKLFLVGDPKQAIYRFRRADVRTYRDVKDLLLGEKDEPTLLKKSFRSVPAIQRFVNAAFAPVMDGDAFKVQARYVPLEPHRSPRPGQPPIVVLPVPEPYGTRNISARRIEESLPDAAGAFVAWLVGESGWRVEREPGQWRPIEPRDVCLLFRRFVKFNDDMTRPYVDALEKRGIPHLLVGGRSFHDREEVETIKAALAAIEWPDDELSVYATLRGSLFGFTDEVLLDYKQRYRRLDPAVPAPDAPGTLQPLVEALHVLRHLHAQRNRVPVTTTLARLLEITRAHVGFVLRPGGERALANVLHVAELARRYEEADGLSFRGFVERMTEASGPDDAEAPVLEEGSDGVRLMTVHSAKGLEFPVVILADMTAKLTHQSASRFIDPGRQLCAVRIGGWAPFELLNHEAEELAKDEAEGHRIAYVAATRARDLLVVPAVGDEEQDGWLGPINAGIYPERKLRAEGEPAPGCPAFGRDSVLTRPDGDPRRADTVAPGLHRFADGYEIVWWDPRALALLPGPRRGVSHEDLLAKDVDAAELDEGRRTFAAWQAWKDEALRKGSSPSVIVETVARRATRGAAALGRGAGTDVEVVEVVEVVELSRASDRPRGPRHGRLVHDVLATVPLDADGGAVERGTRQHARLLGAVALEVASAVTIVRAVLGHAVMDRARLASRCRRESSILWRDDAGTLVEGVVDLAFEEDEAGWTVVDFKTDEDLARGLDRYRRQVALYAGAIARATGRPVRGMILRV